MDATFDVYVVFGEYVTETSEGHRYYKQPISAWLFEGQAQAHWYELEQDHSWVPSGSKYVSAYFAPRAVALYPDEG